MDWKKNFKEIVRMIPEEMIQDTEGNIHKKCKDRKQAEGDHFEYFCNTYQNSFEFSFRC